MAKTKRYHERLLHWLWKHRHLQPKHLTTYSGKKIHIHHPGYLNSSDGPDFTNARISIDRLKWHGDVEIHWKAEEWYAHHHHTDANYNRVILHVIYEGMDPRTATCQDGSLPPTLVLKPFLSQPLQHFFYQYKQPKKLPCAGSIPSVPESIIKQQFEKSQGEYFEQKVNDQLEFYEATLPLSRAWPHMLIIALFDVLGISHNREPMKKLASKLLDATKNFESPEKLSTFALKIAGIDPPNENAPFNWKRKGSRPANHPRLRISQGCSLFCYIQQKPFKAWLHTDIKRSFQTMLESIQTNPSIGSHQADILFGTAWLPAFYLLGELTGTRNLRQQAKEYWSTHRTKLPHLISQAYEAANFPDEAFKQKLGTVHQYRAYCKTRQCDQCDVFNNIISP